MKVKLARYPLALGMTRWGPLPDTMDLYLFWDGPGSGIFLEHGIRGNRIRICHPSASGIYDTPRQAQRAVDAFTAAGMTPAGETEKLKESQPNPPIDVDKRQPRA